MSAAPRGTLGTVHNAAVVLRELAQGPAHHQLTDVAERSDMSPATVHRLLRSLTAAGLVEQDETTSRYGLGPALVELAEQYLLRHPVRTVASPYLVDLRNATRATVVIAELAGQRVLLLDRIDGDDAGGVYRQAGRNRRAVDTAVGRLLLAHGDDETWEAVADPAGLDGDAREHWSGDTVVHDDRLPDGRPGVVGAVRDARGAVIAAVGATRGPVEHDLEDLAAGVRRATAAVSRTLGHH